MICCTFEGGNGIDLVDELESRIEPHECRNRWKCEIAADRIAHLRSEDRSEPQYRERDIWMPDRCFAYESLHLREVALEPTWCSLWSGGFVEDGWIAWTCAVEGGVGLDDHRPDRAEALYGTEEGQRAHNAFLSLGVLAVLGCGMNGLEVEDDVRLDVEYMSCQCQPVEGEALKVGSELHSRFLVINSEYLEVRSRFEAARKITAGPPRSSRDQHSLHAAEGRTLQKPEARSQNLSDIWYLISGI